MGGTPGVGDHRRRDGRLRRALATSAAVGLLLAACSPDEETDEELEEAPTDEGSAEEDVADPEPEDADPDHDGPAYLDDTLAVDERVEDLLGRMSLEQKLGQMTQIEVHSVAPGDVQGYELGSVLSGGGGTPPQNDPASWADMIDGFQEDALDTELGIPLLYGVDAVHGHNNVVGATIFPHNIGLGAAGDAQLVRDIGDATAIEMLATGAHWNFAPVLAVPQDIRWGRTYEAYSDDHEVVTELATAFLQGLQSVQGPPDVIGTPKHFVADGAAAWGTSEHPDGWHIDQGDTSISEQELREVHMAPYEDLIDAGARTIMGSYSSWEGEKVHGREDVMTGMLRDDLGFDGLLLSDWGAVDQIDDDDGTAVVTAVNAGMDMNMVPYDAQRWISTLEGAIENGDVSEERIDEAVERILTVKFEIGLFEEPFAHRDLLGQVGSDEHRELARGAAQASVTTLVGEELFPLPSDTERVVVSGPGANDVGMQSGGWTIEWQGATGAITPGTTILEGVEQAVGENVAVVHAEDGEVDGSAELGIVVVGEEPYAEGVGDDPEPSLDDADLALIEEVRGSVDELVVMVLSGRPLLLGDAVDVADAVVAAWLPGSEGDGVVDALFDDEGPTGTLPMGWIDAPDQIGPDGAQPWLPRGHPG